MKKISNNYVRFLVHCIALSFVFFAFGCNSSKKLSLISVKGKVTWNNSNLTSGQITFHPLSIADKGAPHRNAFGKIDSSGNYSLSTVRKDDGIQPGKYAVAVVCYVPGDIPKDAESEPAILIPKKYLRADTTPLRAEIPEDASGELTIDFNLEEK